ncbi:hypothetical protein NITMOv2_2084 [Nitrospira moscoviensis]|uniref:Uncharacterized protein n=1 Tax=Nitrospira moscoviensis TaxID=42253 RepID=A0A0K2GC17_NITMO|nr:hypothetical protein NITMOv2_2084 [Nitrospira moscoviensis]
MDTCACCRASATTVSIVVIWARAANSGTTPPNLPCTACWLLTTLARTRPSRSSTAPAVSSQEDSIPRTGLGVQGDEAAELGIHDPRREAGEEKKTTRPLRRTAAGVVHRCGLGQRRALHKPCTRLPPSPPVR